MSVFEGCCFFYPVYVCVCEGVCGWVSVLGSVQFGVLNEIIRLFLWVGAGCHFFYMAFIFFLPLLLCASPSL